MKVTKPIQYKDAGVNIDEADRAVDLIKKHARKTFTKAVMTDIGTYLDFVLTMFVAFGITFEVPVAVVLLVKIGVVSVAQLKQVRPYAIVGAFIIGAIFTPPDVVSQIMLAVPLWLLYELGILVAGIVSKPGAAVEDYQPLTEPETDNIEAGKNKRSG